MTHRLNRFQHFLHKAPSCATLHCPRLSSTVHFQPLRRHYSVYPPGDLAGSINMGLKSQQAYVYAYVQDKSSLSSLDCLYENGFIEYYHFTKGKSFRPVVQIGLKRFMGREVFHGIQVWSRPGHKKHANVRQLAQLKKQGLHFLVKTPRGVITDDQAMAYNIGGELLFRLLK